MASFRCSSFHLYIPYDALHVNSNTFIAEGLHRLGFSQKQISDYMFANSSELNNPGWAIGISAADRTQLEDELNGSGFDYSSSDENAAGGYGANHPPGQPN